MTFGASCWEISVNGSLKAGGFSSKPYLIARGWMRLSSRWPRCSPLRHTLWHLCWLGLWICWLFFFGFLKMVDPQSSPWVSILSHGLIWRIGGYPYFGKPPYIQCSYLDNWRTALQGWRGFKLGWVRYPPIFFTFFCLRPLTKCLQEYENQQDTYLGGPTWVSLKAQNHWKFQFVIIFPWNELLRLGYTPIS